MIANAIPAAYQALRLGQETSFEEGMFDGRDVTHWSSHLLVAGAVVGLVTMLAGIVLNQMVVAIQGGMLLGTNAIGSHYISKFGVFYAADEVIQALAKKVYVFWEQNVSLQKKVEEIRLEGDRLQEATEKIKVMMKERTQLQKQREKYLQQFAESEKKVVRTAETCKSLGVAFDKFIGAAALTSKTNAQFEENMARLNTALAELGKVRGELAHLTGEVITGQRALKFVSGIFNRYQMLKDHNKKLKAEVDALQESIAKMTKNNEEMARIEKTLLEILPRPGMISS